MEVQNTQNHCAIRLLALHRDALLEGRFAERKVDDKVVALLCLTIAVNSLQPRVLRDPHQLPALGEGIATVTSTQHGVRDKWERLDGGKSTRKADG